MTIPVVEAGTSIGVADAVALDKATPPSAARPASAETSFMIFTS
jgi:hypothetical protein